MSWPREVEVLIETPRGGFVKRRADGSIDYVSPLPSPFNYGCVPDRTGGDGDPLDAVLLGPRRPRGWRGRVAVRAVVRFVDDGRPDDKLVCGDVVTGLDRVRLRLFFAAYALLKRGLNRARGRRGETAYRGVAPI